jgi:TetR/AcrR family transcriptional repressor of lmrAB and yxaGH operons
VEDSAPSSKGQRTRAKLVSAAADLLQHRGYHATGLSDVVEHSGAPRGSLYFYFPDGKEALACCAIGESGGQWRRAIDQLIGASADLPSAVVSVCDALAETLIASDYASGCPVATVALESAVSSELVRSACAEHFEELKRLIFGHVRAALRRQAGGRGGAKLEAKATSSAVLMICAIEGALLLSKVSHDLAPLRSVAASLQSMLRELLPPGGSRRRSR